MSYGWENSNEDEHATDAVARGGSMIRDKLLKELEAKDKDLYEVNSSLEGVNHYLTWLSEALCDKPDASFDEMLLAIEANKKEITKLRNMLMMDNSLPKITHEMIDDYMDTSLMGFDRTLGRASWTRDAVDFACLLTNNKEGE